MKGRHFWTGVAGGVVLVWVYHHFAPGKGIGQPGGSGSGG
jgi:hypothetical protein